MRPHRLATQFALILTAGLLCTGIALADGATREAPIEQMEQPSAVEEVAAAPAATPEEETAAPPAAMAMARALTACEQMRIDIHDTQRGYYDRRRDDRAAAYKAMRAGDPSARYLCIGTTCTPKRQHQLASHLMQWTGKRAHLEERLAGAPLGASDDCRMFQASMMSQYFKGANWHRMAAMHRNERADDRMDGERRDRRDPFEIEMDRRYQRARATRGY